MELASPTYIGDQYVPKIIPTINFDKVYLNSTKTVNVSLIQRGAWSKKSFMEYDPPKLEEHYTYFTVKQYFFIFWGILLLHSLAIIFTKWFISDQFRNLKWYDKIFHAMECINFAFPSHDWDHEDGDGHQHYQRMQAAKKEEKINLLINTIFNLILLFPLQILCETCLIHFTNISLIIYSRVQNNLDH